MVDLSGLKNLKVLDLSSNDRLTGTITLQVPQEETDADGSKGLPTNTIIAISVSIAFIILIALCAFIAYKCYFKEIIKRRKRKARHDEVSELYDRAEKDQNAFENASPTTFPLPLILMKIFGIKKLRITAQISKGGFGYVYKGVYEGRHVAVKRLIAPERKKDKLRLAAMFSKLPIS
jgi:hypothetical protein